jgi:hypothetical protein
LDNLLPRLKKTHDFSNQDLVARQERIVAILKQEHSGVDIRSEARKYLKLNSDSYHNMRVRTRKQSATVVGTLSKVDSIQKLNDDKIFITEDASQS